MSYNSNKKRRDEEIILDSNDEDDNEAMQTMLLNQYDIHPVLFGDDIDEPPKTTTTTTKITTPHKPTTTSSKRKSISPSPNKRSKSNNDNNEYEEINYGKIDDDENDTGEDNNWEENARIVPDFSEEDKVTSPPLSPSTRNSTAITILDKEDPNFDNDKDWYKQIESKTITNKHIDEKLQETNKFKLPDKWLLHIGTIENCEFELLDDENIEIGKQFHIVKCKDTNTLEAYSMDNYIYSTRNTNRKVGKVKIRNNYMPTLLPVIRKNYVRLLATITSYSDEDRIDLSNATVDIDCYLSHFTEIDDRIDKTEPPTYEIASSSLITVLGNFLNTLFKNGKLLLNGRKFTNLINPSILNKNNNNNEDQQQQDDMGYNDQDGDDNLVKKNLGSIIQPPFLKTKLLPHQLEGIWWMRKRELNPYAVNSLTISRYWRIYTCSIVGYNGQDNRGSNGGVIKFYYNNFCDKITLYPPQTNYSINGGMLCDTMGLGKTIMSLTLILSNHPKLFPSVYYNDFGDDFGEFEPGKRQKEVNTKILSDIRSQLNKRKNHYFNNSKNNKSSSPTTGSTSPKLLNPKQTLVIVPMNVLKQWNSEIEKHVDEETRKKLTITIYHGKNRSADNLLDSDIVFTTHYTFSREYSAYEKEYKKKTKNIRPPPLICIHWWRVIIDESQKCSVKSIFFRSLKNLDSINRWSLTGTPFSNECKDLFPMMSFLRVYPIARNIKTWNKMVENEKDKKKKLRVIKTYLNPILLHRKRKDVDLPINNITEVTINLNFDLDEQMAYRLVFKESKDAFNKIEDRGDLNSHYSLVLQLLSRLRRCCDHSSLIKPISTTFDNQLYCCHCCEEITDGQPSISNCDHLYCNQCLDYLFGRYQSPNCKRCNQRLLISPEFQQIKYQALLKKQTQLSKVLIDQTTDNNGNNNNNNNNTIMTPVVGGKSRLSKSRQVELDVLKQVEANQDFTEMGMNKDQLLDNLKTVRCQLFSTKIRALFNDIQETLIQPEDEEYEEIKDDYDDDEILDNGYGIGNKIKRSFDDLVNEDDEKSFETEYKSKSKLKKGKKKKSKSLNSSSSSVNGDNGSNNNVNNPKLKPATGKNQLKCIIFSHWTMYLDLIEEAFKANQWIFNKDFCRYDGKLNQADREFVIKSFRDDEGPRVLLMSLQSGAIGLNLERASIVYLCDPPFSPMLEDQAIGRVDRIGQKRDIIIKRLIMNNSIETKILELHRAKRNNSDAILNDDEDAELVENPTLSVAEMKELFDDQFTNNNNNNNDGYNNNNNNNDNIKDGNNNNNNNNIIVGVDDDDDDFQNQIIIND